MSNMVNLLQEKVSQGSANGGRPLNDETLDVCESVCRCLRNLSFNRGNGEKLAKMNAAAPMVQLLYRGNKGVKVAAGSCLITIASISEENGLAVANFGAIPPTVELLTDKHEIARLGAVQMIHELSRREKNRVKIFEENALPRMVEIITEQYSGALVHLMQENAIRACVHLCQIEAHWDTAIDAGIVEGAFHSLEHGTDLAKEAGALCLLLMWKRIGTDALSTRSVPMIADLIQPDKPFALRIAGSQCCMKLYVSDEARLKFARHGGEISDRNTMRTFLQMITVLQLRKQALATILHFTDLKQVTRILLRGDPVSILKPLLYDAERQRKYTVRLPSHHMNYQSATLTRYLASRLTIGTRLGGRTAHLLGIERGCERVHDVPERRQNE